MNTTVIIDPELEYELQELYILSKHWISDIQFAEDEIRFLKNIHHKYLVPELNDKQLIEIEGFNKLLAGLDANIPDLKNKIISLLKYIGPFLTDQSNKEINLSLVEKFNSLEIEIKTMFESVKLVKKSLFAFIEAVMKTECNVFVKQF